MDGRFQARLDLAPASPLRLPCGGREGTTRIRDGGVERLIHDGGEPVILRAWVEADGRVTLIAEAATQTLAERGLRRLRHWSGVDDDLSEFYGRFRADPLIGRSISSAPHLRPWRQPMPFEVLMWAICEQLITDERALGIKRAILRRHGRRDPISGLVDSASAEVAAAVSTAELERCGLSGNRSLTLVRVAHEVAKGRVDLDAAPPAREVGWRRLRTIPGVGSWTVATLALNGQGDHDAIPAGDHGYRMLLGGVLHGPRRGKATEAEVLTFMERYRGWRGLAGLHLLRVGPSGIASALRDL